MSNNRMDAFQAATAPPPLPMHGFESEIIYFIVFALISLIILGLGFLANHLRRNTSKKVIVRRIISDFIIVFICVCLPIVWTSFIAFYQSKDLKMFIPAIIPIFLAGLNLESRAERIVNVQ